MIESKLPTENEDARRITIPTKEEIFAPDLNEFYGSQPRNPLPPEPTPFMHEQVINMYPADDNKNMDEIDAVDSDTSDEGEFPPTTLYQNESL